MTAEQDKPGGSRLARWSQRKAEARQAEARQEVEPDARAEQPADVPIDPATLPSVETLTEASDFTVFLQAGVPEGLRREALRKLWRIEPSVVNYKPLVEYNWDFNAPGYGALLPTDDVVQMLRQVLSGAIPKEAEAAADAPPDEAAIPEGEPAALALPESESESLATMTSVAPTPVQEETFPAEPRSRRRHGGALPS